MAITAKDEPTGPKTSDIDLANPNPASGVATMGSNADEYERSRLRQLLTPEEEKKLLRRTDWHLMPLCSIIFMFKNLDSDNVSNARIMNRGSDLNIMTQLGMSSDAYALIPYILGEAPSNLLIKRFSPSKWQPRISVSWGVVLGLHCLAKNATGLYIARFFSGLFETGQFPGLFLVESLATVVMGVIVWFTLPDFPTPSGPQILNIPIPILGLALIATTGLLADNARLPRPLYPLAFLTIILACYGVLVAYPSNAAVYAATMIGNDVTTAWYPMMWPWRVQTTARATGSAFAIGFVNSYGQIGGAVGPQLFRDAYALRYRVAFGVAMALVGACACVTLVTWFPTRRTESETRWLKRARLAAARRGESFLEELSN
ncbi:major facilitator superfamily domain-containing protein [Apiospora phragmitis]|uniref:Major facilitator superfamily domain-containing protein n=1 Tax=Apiospora phragmitis TaxID=2905665 RepID=A0ABR1T9B4_9PEZI